MRGEKSLKVKAGLLMAVFSALLSLSMLALPYLMTEDVWNPEGFSSPEIKIDTPTARELMQEKFAKYNTVSSEGTKKTVTIFSQEQIKDIQACKKRGERFDLTTREMVYLIDNTYELFKTYDVVYLYDAEGVRHKYYGVNFYTSEEYFGLFGKLCEDSEDDSFRFIQDLYDAILLQAEVHSDAFVRIEEKRFVGFDAVLMTDLETPLLSSERSSLALGFNPWRKGVTDEYGNPIPEDEKRHCGFWKFSNGTISFHRDAAAMEHSPQDQHHNELINFYPDRFDLSHMGIMKYDSIGNVVVIELTERESGKILGRLRFDDENNPEVIEKLMELHVGISEVLLQTEFRDPGGDYYAVVYFNDFGYSNQIKHLYYVYCPDGDTDLYGLNGYELKADEQFYYCGGEALSRYINQLLKEGFGIE